MALSFSLLPEKTLSGVNRTMIVDSYGLNSSIVSVPVSIKKALYAPANGTELRLLPEGYRDNEVYMLYTPTRIYAAIEGTTRISSRVTLPKSDGTSITCEVIKEQDWSYDPIEQQYVYWIVRINER